MEERQWEIAEKLRDLERREDEIHSMTVRFRRKEEEEDNVLYHALSQLDEMYESCPEGDVELRQLIEEQRYRLNEVRNRKAEFAEEFAMRVNEERRNLDTEREGLMQEMKEAHEEGGKWQ